MKVGDIIRTRTGKTDQIVTEVGYDRSVGTTVVYRSLRNGQPFGRVRWGAATDLTLVKEASC